MSRENVLLLKIAFFLSLLVSVCCLYEDQIGKFDWRRSFVGKLQDGFFDSVGNDLILMTSEEGVVAGLSAKTGDILWRQVLEKSPRGDIKHAAFYMDTQSVTPQSTLLTVSGQTPTLIRGWNPTEGFLMWEWSLTSHYPDRDDLWFSENLMLYHVIPFWDSHIELTQYYASTGQQLKPGSSKISAAWIKKGKCVLAVPFFVCAIETQVIGVNLISENGQIFSKTLLKPAQSAPRIIPGLRATILVNDEVINLEDSGFSLKMLPNSRWFVSEVENRRRSQGIRQRDCHPNVIQGFPSAQIRGQDVEVLEGGGSNAQVIQVAGKNPIEHVHSQGRVLSDRSVLYKYVNPNLIAIATFSLDAIHKYVINVHLIDVVSGYIVQSLTHRRAKGPLHMVHSENWLVYSYYNDKVRRTEITTIELYEGKIQTNSTVWSSLTTPPVPKIERQSYIIPANVFAMKETITEKGITNKDVLIGLSTGAIVEMPWALLDPRRPVTTTQNQAREEGVIPYIPELPLPSEQVINYNQSIARIRGIYTAPSGLESTCLVIAHGLDMFVTRVAPSKTFDLLKEDFDYFLISIVLLGLTVASYVVKHLASRKAIKQAWK
uniref:ER membrane protein complex subunit 1 n=1 Tax=Phlebotomus papatasi TaxID=29031 RepID=A0A1B0D303_PHLPP